MRRLAWLVLVGTVVLALSAVFGAGCALGANALFNLAPYP